MKPRLSLYFILDAGAASAATLLTIVSFEREAMSYSDIAVSVLTIGICVAAIVTCLRTVWAELSSSLSTRTEIEILLEEYELRLSRLDAILDQAEGGHLTRNSAE